MTRLGSATWFGLRRLAHNVRYLIFAMAMPVGFYLLYSHMYGRYAVSGIPFGSYFMASMATFGAIGTALNVAGTQTSQDRSGGFTRLLRVTPLPPWAYTAGQVVTAAVASAVTTALILLVAHVLGKSSLGGREILACVAIWLGSLAFAAIGLCLAYALDASTVTYGTLTVYLGTAFLGGLMTPLAILPPVFRTLAAWMPSFRIADMAWHLLAGRAVPWADVGVLTVYAVFFAGMAAALHVRRG